MRRVRRGRLHGRTDLLTPGLRRSIRRADLLTLAFGGPLILRRQQRKPFAAERTKF